VLTIRNKAGQGIVLDYDEIIFADIEFVAPPGERPQVVCVAWHEYASGITRSLWIDELGPLPPYRTDGRVLFVCFVANAEIGCHLALGWPVPRNVIDLSAEFRCLTNGRKVPAGKGLIGALTYFRIPTISTKEKDEIRNRIMRGFPFTNEERARILEYAKGDVNGILLSEMLPVISSLKTALSRGEFVSILAKMEHKGVPMDMEIYRQLADKNIWAYVRDAMVPELDRDYGVYERDKHGEWHFNQKLFEAYLIRKGVGWPRDENGKLILKNKTFEDMTRGYPELETLRQLRHARNKMRKVKLAVGRDGCNRTTLWAFKSKTGRTQPKAAQWIFSPAVWLRSLIKPGPGMAVAYVDWSSMEFMVGAAISGDPVMVAFYESGDPYLAFAKRVGAAPEWATKHTHGELRDQYKTGLLAIQYGISEYTLSARLNISLLAAREMIEQHKQLFSVYWAWIDDWVQWALTHGEMWTPFDWRCRVGELEFNARSIANFAVQAASADALRIAIVLADRAGLDLRAPVHDALLLHSTIERIEADVGRLQQIMAKASRLVLNARADGKLELRSDKTIVRYPDRYSDKRGISMWNQVVKLLGSYEQ
jgi:DNA polymerase-1